MLTLTVQHRSSSSSQQRVLHLVDFHGTPFFSVGKREKEQHSAYFLSAVNLQNAGNCTVQSFFLLVILWGRNKSCSHRKLY